MVKSLIIKTANVIHVLSSKNTCRGFVGMGSFENAIAALWESRSSRSILVDDLVPIEIKVNTIVSLNNRTANKSLTGMGCGILNFHTKQLQTFF